MQEPFDRRAWAYAMLYVNLYGPQLLYSARIFEQVFLTRTVHVYTCVYMCIHAGEHPSSTYVYAHSDMSDALCVACVVGIYMYMYMYVYPCTPLCVHIRTST